MIGLEDIQVEGGCYRVALKVPVAGRSRRVLVTLHGQRVVDVQADDGTMTWTASAGDPEVTEAAVSRAFEEVVRLKAIQQVVGGRR